MVGIQRRTVCLTIVCAIGLVVSDNAGAATVAQLLGTNDALQCYKSGNDVRCRNLATGEDWKVFTRSSTTVEGWTGSINLDGSKLTCMDGKRIVVVDLDGTNRQLITTWDSTNGYFWRDGSGDDWVVYTGELEHKDQSGTTWRVRINGSTNAPVEATREKLANLQYSCGLGGSGVYLGESYGSSYLYNLVTATKSCHLNGTQNCVGSTHPGDKPWLFYERDPDHHDVVISEWKESGNTARYIWQYHWSSSEIFGLWSCTDESYCVITKGGPLYLVKLQVDTSGSGDNTGSYQEASMGISDYVGRLWVGTLSGGDSTPPSAPTGLSASAAGSSTIQLDWADNSEGDLNGYNVYRSTTSGSGYVKVNGSLVATSGYSNTGLSASTTYYYVVTAVDTSGNESGYSSEKSATTGSGADTTPPAAPTGVVASAAGDSQVDIDWADNGEPDLIGYNVYRGTSAGVPIDASHRIAQGVPSSAYSDTGLSADTTYYYAVTAVDTSDNESNASGEASATTDPTSGPSITVRRPSAGEVWYVGTTRLIEWDTVDVSDVAISYTTGGSWIVIDPSVDSSQAEWRQSPWTVPNTPSTSCRLLIGPYMPGSAAPDESGVFEIRAVSDSDGDGMDDGWEEQHFGDLSHDGTEDTDGDGASDLEEFMNGTDPASDTDGDESGDIFSCTAGAGIDARAGRCLHVALMIMATALLGRRTSYRAFGRGR